MKYTLTPEGRNYPAYYKKYLRKYVNVHNRIIKLFKKNKIEKSSSPELNEIRERALVDTDISDHLETIFNASLAVKPKLIVELGVRTGESTFVFERVARLSDAVLLSVDIEPQQRPSSWSKASFIKKDDIVVADEFVKWCELKGIPAKIDVLFIDTSHEYNHTKKEIEKWFPFLSEKGIVFFHDANVKLLYKRRNGTIGKAYSDDRDVMRAIEEHVGTKFNEKKDFIEEKNGWNVEHHSVCNGMTILRKI